MLAVRWRLAAGLLFGSLVICQQKSGNLLTDCQHLAMWAFTLKFSWFYSTSSLQLSSWFQRFPCRFFCTSLKHLDVVPNFVEIGKLPQYNIIFKDVCWSLVSKCPDFCTSTVHIRRSFIVCVCVWTECFSNIAIQCKTNVRLYCKIWPYFKINVSLNPGDNKGIVFFLPVYKGNFFLPLLGLDWCCLTNSFFYWGWFWCNGVPCQL